MGPGPGRASAWPRGVRHAAAGSPGAGGRHLQRAATLYTVAAFTVAVPVALVHYAGWPLPRHIPAWSQLPAAVMAAPPGTVIASDPGLRGVAGLAHLRRMRGRRGARRAQGPPLAEAAWAGPGPGAGVGRGRRVGPHHSPPGPQPCRRLPAPPHPGPGAGTRPASLTAGPRPASRDSRPCARARSQPHLQERPGTDGAGEQWAYRVAAGDSLWDIAQRYLGDPQRWREIFALNRGRSQPGGRSLTDPALIYPGWTLLLPPASRRPAAPHRTAGRARPPGPPPPPQRHQLPPGGTAATAPPCHTRRGMERGTAARQGSTCLVAG